MDNHYNELISEGNGEVVIDFFKKNKNSDILFRHGHPFEKIDMIVGDNRNENFWRDLLLIDFSDRFYLGRVSDPVKQDRLSDNYWVKNPIMNQYMYLRDNDVVKLLYHNNPHDGLYLAQCPPAGESFSSEAKFLVCLYENITLVDIVTGIRENMGKPGFADGFYGYDGDDGRGGLLTWSKGLHGYYSIFEGSAARHESKSDTEDLPKRGELGMYIDYINYMIALDIPQDKWSEKDNQIMYLENCGHESMPVAPKRCESDFIADNFEETLALFCAFDPEMVV